MSTPFELVITDAGIAELAQSGTQAKLTIAEMGVSSTALTKDTTRTSIPGEFERVAISGGRVIDNHVMHVAGLIPAGTPEKWIRTVAYYSDTGTLIGYFSPASGAITWRGQNADVLPAYDIGFYALPAGSIQLVAGTPEFDLLFTKEFANHGSYLFNLNHHYNLLRDRVKALEETAEAAQ